MLFKNNIFFLAMYTLCIIAFNNIYGLDCTFCMVGDQMARGKYGRDDENANLTNKTNQTLFITSSEGAGYQTQIAPGATISTQLLDKGSMFRALKTSNGNYTVNWTCQQPLGTNVTCDKKLTVEPVSGNFEDRLNERKTKTVDLNHIFLDTIINNSEITFEVWATDAPLYSDTAGASIYDVLTSTENTLDTIYKNQKITLGAHEFDVKPLLSDGSDYNQFQYSSDAGIKRLIGEGKLQHLANSDLALATAPGAGTQTLILFPNFPIKASVVKQDDQRKIYISVQPIILIGRDSNNALYAVSFLRQSICKDANGGSCKTDGEFTNLRTNIQTKTSTGITQPLPLKKSGRIKLVIDPISFEDTDKYGNTYKVGNVKSLDVLPGLWWPGTNSEGKTADDFVDKPATTPALSTQKTTTLTALRQ